MNWRETRARLREDRDRLRAHLLAEGGHRTLPLWMNPSFQAVALQRLSHLFYSRGYRLLGRFLWHSNVMLTGADLSMICDIGGGFLMPVPAGIILISARIGRNCTVWPQGGLGGGMRSNADIGGGPGLPVLGDGVELGWGAIVMGPVRVGNGARIGPLSLVTRDVPDGGNVPPGEGQYRDS